MNQNKVAFIICANNEHELSECVGYLDRLVLPEGFEKDVISVAEAPSMAAGYNAGMHSSDAKYKVYIHQDTFIINQNFIFDMLQVFADKEVGLFGVVGARKIPRNSYAVTAWDTGKVYHAGNVLLAGYQKKDKCYTEVEAVDGLILVTQYDVEFREDLFEDWDFYDLSACYEFRRAGYKVVVPYQDECWIFHNNKFSKMAKYDKNREIFAQEYSKDFDIDATIEPEPIDELEESKFETINHLNGLIDAGNIKTVCDVLLSNDEYRFNCLKDIRLLAEIYHSAPKNSIFRWDGTSKELYVQLNELKYFLKRVEYDVEMNGEEYRFFVKNYPIHAFVEVVMDYCRDRKNIMRKIGRYIDNKELVKVLVQGLPNEEGVLKLVKDEDSYKVYNEEYTVNKKTIFIVDESINEENNKLISELILKEAAVKESIVFSRVEKEWAIELIENKVPVVICKMMNTAGTAVLNYLSQEEWEINQAVYIGCGKFENEVRRMLVNTGIKQQTLAEYIDEVYADNDARKYEYIAHYLAPINPIQAELLLHPEIKKTSIVVLSYNTLELTKGCIESIRATLQPDEYELIIVDNASTDGSVEYLKQQADIKLLCNEENKGFAGGCNQGIKMAEPENDIWLLNSDTLVPEHALLWLKMGLYADEYIGACGSVSNFCPNYQNTIETEVNVDNYREVAAKYNHYMENALEKKNWLVGFSMLIKREALKKTGYLDEQFFPGNFEDNDLSYRLLQAGYSLQLCHNSFVFHYGSQSFKKTNTVSKSLIENRERFVNKWGFEPETYTEIKSRQIAMLDEKAESEFSVLDLNAGVGATLARLEYMYPRVFVAGTEDNAKVAEIARLNGHLIADKFDRKFDYVLCDDVSPAVIESAERYLKEHGKIIGSSYNSYYKELLGDKRKVSSYTGERLLQMLTNNGYEVQDISFVRGRNYDAQKVAQLCKKYNCDENLVVAEKFYFVAKHVH